MKQTNKRQQIKEVALSLFARKGYEATTMNDIADTVGLKKQSLYAHFESKQDIYLEVLQDQNRLFIHEVEKAVSLLEGESAEILLKGIFRTITILFSDRDRLLLWKRITLFDAQNGLQAMEKLDSQRSFMADFIGLFQKTCPSIEPDSLRSILFSFIILIEGYLDNMVLLPSKADLFNQVWDNFWNGIKKSL